MNLRYLHLLDLYSHGEVFFQLNLEKQRKNFWLKTRFGKKELRKLRDLLGLVMVDYVRKENGFYLITPNYVGKNDCYEPYSRPRDYDPFADDTPLRFDLMQ